MSARASLSSLMMPECWHHPALDRHTAHPTRNQQPPTCLRGLCSTPDEGGARTLSSLAASSSATCASDASARSPATRSSSPCRETSSVNTQTPRHTSRVPHAQLPALRTEAIAPRIRCCRATAKRGIEKSRRLEALRCHATRQEWNRAPHACRRKRKWVRTDLGAGGSELHREVVRQGLELRNLSPPGALRLRQARAQLRDGVLKRRDLVLPLALARVDA